MGNDVRSIHILSGNTDDSTTLDVGQPFYNSNKNYLTVGKPGTGTTPKLNDQPITVRKVVGYFEDESGISNTTSTDDEYSIKPEVSGTTKTLEINSTGKLSLSASSTVSITTGSSILTVSTADPHLNTPMTITADSALKVTTSATNKSIKTDRKIESTADIQTKGNIIIPTDADPDSKVIANKVQCNYLTRGSGDPIDGRVTEAVNTDQVTKYAGFTQGQSSEPIYLAVPSGESPAVTAIDVRCIVRDGTSRRRYSASVYVPDISKGVEWAWDYLGDEGDDPIFYGLIDAPSATGSVYGGMVTTVISEVDRNWVKVTPVKLGGILTCFEVSLQLDAGGQFTLEKVDAIYYTGGRQWP